MILILALLASHWPQEWYASYSLMDWDEMAAVSHLWTEGSGMLAAKAISDFGTGSGDPESTALEAILADSGDYRGWTALALTAMAPDTSFMDSIFTRAYSLTEAADPVLLEIHGYWLLSIGRFTEAADIASLAVEADSGFGPGWLTLSMAYSDAGLMDEALQVSRQAVGRIPESLPLLHQHAQVLHDSGRPLEAIDAYSALIRADSSRISAYADLGVLYEEQGMVGHAVKTYRLLLERSPDYAWAWGKLGAIMVDLNRPALAESLFTAAVELDPGDSWALYRLGRLASGSDPERARDLLEAAVAVSPDYSPAWQELTFVYETLDDLPSAETALLRAIELEPDAWLYGELGYVRESMGKLEEAASAFESGVAMDSQYLYGWQRRGEVYITEADTLAAWSWFSAALDSLGEDDPWILGRMGNLAAGMGMMDSSRMYLERALELDPGDPYLLLDLARAADESGDPESALIYLDQCLESFGDTMLVSFERLLIREDAGPGILPETIDEADILSLWPGGWVSSGWSNLGSGFTRRAGTCAERGLGHPPEDPWALVNLGELFGELGRPKEMEECYRLAEESPLRTAEHTVTIANHHFRNEDYHQSIKLLLQEYRSNPEDHEVATALAEAYLFDDQLDEAEEILLQVVEKDPLSVYAICYLGLIQENRGVPEAAAERYLQALRIEPGYSYAEDRLRFICGDGYDPQRRRNMNRTFDWDLWVNLSSTGGNTDEQYYGGGGSLGYNYGEGSSLELDLSGTVEIKDDEDLRRTAWASIEGEHFISEHLYAGASSSWDRQPLTVRPWQVSSYLAAGWKSWPADWMWIAPETGAGLVNTRWSTSQGRTDEWTVYGSLSLWAKSRVDWLPSLWLSGSLYLPPEEPSSMVSSGVGELEFDLPGPVSLITGVSLDYTRTPVVESWEKLDSEIYVRLRL